LFPYSVAAVVFRFIGVVVLPTCFIRAFLSRVFLSVAGLYLMLTQFGVLPGAGLRRRRVNV